MYSEILIFFLIKLSKLHKSEAAVYCEGGHICTTPRECCSQGCCPPIYQSGPRQLPPATDHVLNLFFISHWYFWCVVVAVILAIFCAYSLWRKRRQLCGWGFSDHHRSHSEGDSAGSCYAPPQYSRCSSFHHPPPPYTEVTSKPDLYPLVFTCNNTDNGKNGASYLMVQYFRNYIVRPVGSLSAASTVDSLSSSFICNANEANTLVPPPYSRAASPEIGIHSQFQHSNQIIPRSASQLVCSQENAQNYNNTAMTSRNNIILHNLRHQGFQHQQQQPQSPLQQFPSRDIDSNDQQQIHRQIMPRTVVGRPSMFMTSQSDQQFRYISNSNSTISDIFVNNSYNSYCVDGNGQGQGELVDTQPAVNSNNHSSTNTNHSDGVPTIVPGSNSTDDALDISSFNCSSAVSSLLNIGSPKSPPQATSPTGEVKEILEQIRQLAEDQTPSPIENIAFPIPKQQPRPSSLHQHIPNPRKKMFSKPNKAMYIPMVAKYPSPQQMSTTSSSHYGSGGSRLTLKSPVSVTTNFLGRSRCRKGWISKSAPTTPAGSGLPPNCLGDDSPLLNENDEEQEL
ncbi:hypothetical protein ACFFRR_001387 [Megaselia abdita]